MSETKVHEWNVRPPAPPWDRQIPELMLDLYLNGIRNYPVWRKMCPQYIHPDVKEASELGYHTTRLKTTEAEYVFKFSVKTTIIEEIAEDIKTGELEIRCNNTAVLKVGASCSDGDLGRVEWEPRSVELFVDGDWVHDLLHLALQQKAHEEAQLNLEEKQRQKHADELTNLRERMGFGGEPRKTAPARISPTPTPSSGWQRLRFWKGRSG